MVDAADDTCVGYLLKNLLRVRSSGIHVLLVDMAAVGGGCDDEGKGACSEELSRVMPRSIPWEATPTKRCANYARSFDIRTQAGEPDGTQSSLSICEQTVRRPTIIHPSDSLNFQRRRGIDQSTTGSRIEAQKSSTWWQPRRIGQLERPAGRDVKPRCNSPGTGFAAWRQYGNRGSNIYRVLVFPTAGQEEAQGNSSAQWS